MCTKSLQKERELDFYILPARQALNTRPFRSAGRSIDRSDRTPAFTACSIEMSAKPLDKAGRSQYDDIVVVASRSVWNREQIAGWNHFILVP